MVKFMNDYARSPTEEHYGCMMDLIASFFLNSEIDLLANAGPIEAEPSNRSSLHVSQFNIHVDDRTWKMVENTVIYKTGELLLKSLDFTSIEVKKRLILFSFDDVLSYESTKIDYIQNCPRSEMRD
ncbi:hypothetical protein K1719_006792 [Acacia pycnantha]|nr:hypothetical protein K1719_006792 [Acacia pycnantha]